MSFSDPLRWVCMDCACDVYDEYFMVDHLLWESVVPKGRGKLCVRCLEFRLGRELTPDDFIPCPANDPTWRKTPLLRQRLGPDIGLRSLTKKKGKR